MPITRQPWILAIWPAIEPVAPAAPETTTVSPALGLPREQPEIGGDAGDAEHRERLREGGAERDAAHHRAASGQRVLLPAEHAGDEIAGLVVGMVRLDHLADAHAAHHVAERHRRDVAGAVLHPAPHRRLEGQVEVPHQHLPVPGRCHRGHGAKSDGFTIPLGRAASSHWRFTSFGMGHRRVAGRPGQDHAPPGPPVRAHSAAAGQIVKSGPSWYASSAARGSFTRRVIQRSCAQPRGSHRGARLSPVQRLLGRNASRATPPEDLGAWLAQATASSHDGAGWRASGLAEDANRCPGVGEVRAGPIARSGRAP
jgi:hypothetical protein